MEVVLALFMIMLLMLLSNMEQKISDGKDHGLKTKRRSISEMGAVVMVAVVAGVEGPDKDGCDAVVGSLSYQVVRSNE